MMYGEGPFGEYAYGDMDADNSLSIADALDTLLENPHLPRTWLIKAEPRDKDTDTVPVTTISVNLSSDGHSSLPTDEDYIQYPEAITRPYSVGSKLLQGLHGQAVTNEGEVVIGDALLLHRNLASQDWVGRQVNVYLGPRNGAQVSFALVGRMLSRGLHYSRDDMSLIVDSYGQLFDRVFQNNLYAGTGGLEGDTDLTDTPKPVVIGQVRRIQPVLVDGVNRVYQVNDGAFESVAGIEDRGVALVFDVDVADITTATPSAGEYATSLATGHVKLGSDPDGVVVCTDVQGDNGSVYGYVETISDVIKYLAVVKAGLVDPVELDTLAFLALESHTAVMGAYVTSPTTILEVITTFHDSALSWSWLKPNKLLTVGRVTDPAVATDYFSLDASSDELRDDVWSVEPWELPVYRVFVGYRIYYQTVSASDLDSSVSLQDRRDFDKEYRYVKAEDLDVLAQTPQAREITILTNLDTSLDAQALADEQLALRSTCRERGRFSPKTGLIKRGIGDVFELTDDRLGTSPKKWVITEVVNSAETSNDSDSVVFVCFG